MLRELDASTRSRLEHLNAARTDEPPTETALVGERLPVIGHVDEREGPRRLAFGLVEETREHRLKTPKRGSFLFSRLSETPRGYRETLNIRDFARRRRGYPCFGGLLSLHHGERDLLAVAVDLFHPHLDRVAGAPRGYSISSDYFLTLVYLHASRQRFAHEMRPKASCSIAARRPNRTL